MTNTESTEKGQTPQAQQPAQFSLGTLMIVTLAVGFWFAGLQYIPGVAIFASSLVLCSMATRLIGHSDRKSLGWLRRIAHLSCAVLCWSYLYIVSIGPVVALHEMYQGDLGRVLIELFYTPVIWLHDHTFLELPLERYGDSWGWH